MRMMKIEISSDHMLCSIRLLGAIIKALPRLARLAAAVQLEVMSLYINADIHKLDLKDLSIFLSVKEVFFVL